ncbi:hypothetical protein [Oceanidesulfovibrio marinus]|nr:hypothetical protein [Oceanidesulfovibrio marinus]
MKLRFSIPVLLIVAVAIAIGFKYAHAQAQFDVSCSHLKKMYVYELRGQTKLNFVETSKGKEDFWRFTSAHTHQNVAITFDNNVLLEDRVYSPTESIPSIHFPSRDAAEQAARSMCPELLAESPLPSAKPPLPVTPPESINGPAFPLSCDDIASIEVFKQKDRIWRDDSGDGYYYLVIITFAPNVGKRFMRFVESSPEQWLGEHADISRKYVQIRANGTRLTSDAPLYDGFSEESVILIKRTRTGAFEIIRALCHDKAPTVMHVEHAIGVETVPISVQ